MYSEALTEGGKKLWPAFLVFPDFYLAGGTSLALQLGHRISVDFDFFSDKPIPRTLLPLVEKTFRGTQRIVSVNNSDELTLFVDGIKVTFLHYPFPLLFPLKRWDGMRLASSKEIGVMKAYTIGRRGSLKDYVDLYFILLENILSLPPIIKYAEKKYKDAFNTRLFLEQLIYFADISDIEIIWLKNKISPEELKVFFQKKIKAVKF